MYSHGILTLISPKKLFNDGTFYKCIFWKKIKFSYESLDNQPLFTGLICYYPKQSFCLKISCIGSFAFTTFLDLLVQEHEAGIYAALCYFILGSFSTINY